MSLPSLAAILVFALSTGATPGQEAQQTGAFDVAPSDAALVIGIQGIGHLEDELQRFVNYMEKLGLEDPGIAKWTAWLAASSGGKGPLAQQLGLSPDSQVALYVTHAESLIVAIDQVNERRLIKSLKKVMVEEVHQEGDKPPRVTTRRRRLPGGAREISLRLSGHPPMMVRILAGIAVISRHEGALEDMRLGGGSRPAVFNRLKGAEQGLSVAFALLPPTPQADGTSSALLDGPMSFISGIEGVLEFGRHGAKLWTELTLPNDVEPYMAITKPSTQGAPARKAMEGLVGEEPLGWFRFSFDPKAALGLLKLMSGDAFGDILKESKEAYGLDIQKDLVDVFTGDVMFICRESMADCLLAFGTTDSKVGTETFERVLTLAAQAMKATEVDTETIKKTPEFTLQESVFYELEKEGRGKIGKAVRSAQFRLYWGANKDLLLIGLSPLETEASLRGEHPRTAKGPGFMDGRGFNDNDILAAYQVVVDPSNILRELLPIARTLFPAEAFIGKIARGVDTYMAFNDRLVDGGTILRCKGRTLTLDAQARALPSEGDPQYRAPWAQSYERAMGLRYQGKLRSSNLALLKLAEDAPNTPWALKARTYALSGDGFMASLLLIAGGFMGNMLNRDSIMELLDFGSLSSQDLDSGVCEALRSTTCSGPNQNLRFCEIAKTGNGADCERAFEAFLGQP